MKRLSLAVTLLVFCHYGTISYGFKLESKSNLDNWLYMSMGDIQTQCRESKYIMLTRLIGEYRVGLLKPIFPEEEQDYLKWDSIKDRIYYPELVGKLKQVIVAIQSCLPYAKRLDEEGEAEVMERILQSHAIKMKQLEPMSVRDDDCRRSTFASCRSSEPEVSDPKIIDELTISYLYYNCQKNSLYKQCLLTAAKGCKSPVIKYVKAMLSPAEVGMCNNNPQETDSDTTKDIKVYQTKNLALRNELSRLLYKRSK